MRNCGLFKGPELVQTGRKVGAEKALGACGEVWVQGMCMSGWGSWALVTDGRRMPSRVGWKLERSRPDVPRVVQLCSAGSWSFWSDWKKEYTCG